MYIEASPNMSKRNQRSVKDSLNNLATSIVLYPISMVVSIMVARTLGPSGKGVYVFLNMLPVTIHVFGSLGTGTAVNYLVASREFKVHDVALTIFLMAFLLGSLGATAAFWAISLGLSGSVVSDSRLLIIALASAPMRFLADYMSRVLRAQGRFQLSNALDLVLKVALIFFLLLLVVILRMSTLGAILASSGVSLLSALFCSLAALRGERPKLKVSISFARRSFSYGLRAVPAVLAGRLNLRVDQLLLGVLKDYGQLGVYSVAVAFTELIWKVADAVGSVLFTRIARASSEAETAKVTNKACSLVFAITVVVSLLLGASGFWLIPFVYGSEYQASSRLVLLLLPGTVLYVLPKLLSKYFSATDQPIFVSVWQSVGLVAMIPVYLYFVPRYGATGAAIGTSLVYVVVALCSVCIYMKFAGQSLLSTVIPGFKDVRWMFESLGAVIHQMRSRIWHGVLRIRAWSEQVLQR
jgi:O-antigen/teichoic acid export membrane protein